MIQHPLLRCFTRAMSNVYFGKAEPTNLKVAETRILGSLLNIDGGEHFEVDVGHHVAQHLALVAEGSFSKVSVGGLITHIAKKICPNFDESQLRPFSPGPHGEPLTVDLAQLARMHYIRAINHNTWWWKLGNDLLLRLPERGDQKKVKRVITFPETDQGNLDPHYYLLTDPADHQPHDSASDHGGEGLFSSTGANIIEPIGNYDDFAHYPFQTGPYVPTGYDPLTLPPSLAVYPPFSEPPHWNQSARDAIHFGLVNQMHQATLDHTVGAHNIYAYHDSQGHFPPGTTHPAYYRPPHVGSDASMGHMWTDPHQSDNQHTGSHHSTGSHMSTSHHQSVDPRSGSEYSFGSHMWTTPPGTTVVPDSDEGEEAGVEVEEIPDSEDEDDVEDEEQAPGPGLVDYETDGSQEF